MQKTKQKNSLIELYRFIFALNVVKNHGYFPYQGSYFSPGAYSVEFFFVLTGYLLLKSIDKFIDLPIKSGLPKLIWKKLYSLGIPLAIGLIFNVIYKVCTNTLSFDLWMYLWYVQDMLMVIVFYYFIRKFIKKQKNFIIITASVCLISNALHFTDFFYSWGYFRAFGSISAGILLSYLPEFNKKYKKLTLPLLLITAIAVLGALLFNIPKECEIILNNLLYPALIYLTFQLNANCKFLNYLGSLSFGLYAFQSIARCFEFWGVTNLWILFITILIPTLLENTIKRIINAVKQKKQHQGTQNKSVNA